MQALLWDLGNVLVRFGNRNEVCRKIARCFGDVDLPNLFEGKDESAFAELDMGNIRHEELWALVCKTGKISKEELTLPMFSALIRYAPASV